MGLIGVTRFTFFYLFLFLKIPLREIEVKEAPTLPPSERNRTKEHTNEYKEISLEGTRQIDVKWTEIFLVNILGNKLTTTWERVSLHGNKG
jgi:hypothetical protein